MKTTSNLPWLLSAALAAACSVVLLASITEQMNPSRLAAMPHVVEMARVVVTAHTQAAVASVAGPTARN